MSTLVITADIKIARAFENQAQQMNRELKDPKDRVRIEGVEYPNGDSKMTLIASSPLFDRQEARTSLKKNGFKLNC